MARVRFVHVNLIATDWRALADFYIEVFGCTPVGVGRDYDDEWLGRATGLPGARLVGAHLALPGYPEGGPTLEIFEYRGPDGPDGPDDPDGPDGVPARSVPRPDTPGFGHIAFAVADVAGFARRVVARGGSAVGDRVEVDVPAGRLEFQYLRDPEGNIIELQRWS